MRARLEECEDFTGEPCAVETDAAPLPEEWTEVGQIIGVVYRDAQGSAYTHKILDGDLLAAPGFLLIDAPSITLNSRGLTGSDRLH